MLSLRKIVLALALCATVLASWIDLPQQDLVEPLQATGTGASARPMPPLRAPLPPSTLPAARFLAAQPSPDLFAPRHWQPPPASVAPVAVVPRAPPLPFRYLGKVLEEDGVLVFVSQGGLTHLLRRGDQLADYKVEQITSAEMTFVFLPLLEKQRLTFGSAN
jgi:hypothetical protein